MNPNQKQIAIIDYQLGNLFSVKQACEYLGYKSIITSDKNILMNSDYAILPGVGAFGDAMKSLDDLDLVEPMKDFINAGKPFMGVCLGLQLLFSESEEFGSYKGLGIISGTVKKFSTSGKDGEKVKVPQIEWNQIYKSGSIDWEQTPLKNCKEGDYMYFVHSYFVEPEDETSWLSKTTYGGKTYCSSVIRNNVFASQFHPEKSGLEGISIYKNWFDNGNN